MLPKVIEKIKKVYQEKHPQAKLVTCIKGAILDVVVDIRKDSDTFGDWLSVELSENNNKLSDHKIGSWSPSRLKELILIICTSNNIISVNNKRREFQRK